MTMKPTILTGLSGAALLVAGGLALAAGQYGPGVSDTEIKIGQTMPYSGPASSYGTIGKAEAAYFAMVNDQGGINGRKINFISRDDGYSPPKTVEVARQLVEQDHVLLLLNPLGSATNTAIRDYMNENKCLKYSSLAAPLSSTIPSTIHGRWAFSQATPLRGASMAVTSWKTCPTPRLPCSTRMTISVRITLSVCNKVWVTKRAR
jgi:hypothetical protein